MPTSKPNDVIAAIATAPGRGGIGVVRLSGGKLSGLIDTLCGAVPAPRHAKLVTFHAADRSLIDQGLAIYFPGPNSFTGEDVLGCTAMAATRCCNCFAPLRRVGRSHSRARRVY
jgi:tRNA modification GTPase